MLLAGTGIAIGLVAAFALTRLMSSLLYHVSVTDPMTFVAGPVLFAAVALLASYLPARRAMRVDPVIANLRAEVGQDLRPDPRPTQNWLPKSNHASPRYTGT